MKKIYVLDTNVILHDANAINNFQDNIIIIPIVVIEEIDNFKKDLGEKGRNARHFSRYLDNLRKNGNLKYGVVTPRGTTVKVVLTEQIKEHFDSHFFFSSNDNQILAAALWIKQKYNKEVTLVSKDTNVRIKADILELKSQNYETDLVVFDELYTGKTTIELTEADFLHLQEEKFIKCTSNNFYPNQFVFCNFDNNEFRILKYKEKDNSLINLQYAQPGKRYYGIKALNNEQLCALELLLDPDIKLVNLIGDAGTGKTLLAIASGLFNILENSIYSRILVSRPISPMGKELGFLPGTIKEKYNPWMQPIYDNLEVILFQKNKKNYDSGTVFKSEDQVDEFMGYDFIQLEPLTYIRGRSLPNQFIIIDEAQNLTPLEMKTIVSRVGQNSKIVFTGDPYQIDLPYLDSQSNGLSRAVEIMKVENIVGSMTLKKGERSELANLAAKYL